MQMQNQIWKGHLSTSNLTQAVLPLMEAALKGFKSSNCSEVKGQPSAEVLKENSTLGGKDTFMPDSILRNVNIQSKVKSSIPWCLPPERGLHQGSRQVRIWKRTLSSLVKSSSFAESDWTVERMRMLPASNGGQSIAAFWIRYKGWEEKEESLFIFVANARLKQLKINKILEWDRRESAVIYRER